MALGDSMFGQGPSFRERRAEQEYLAYLERTVRGTPGMPVENPVPFEPVEARELVDGPVVAPPPERPKRKRSKRRPVPEEFPTGDRELGLLARKLKGE